MTAYGDVESLTQSWLKTSDLAAVLTRTDGGISVFKGAPNKMPLPSIVLSRVGGAPAAGKDVPEDIARISFDCWAKTRDDAIQVSLALVGELESLALTGGYSGGGSILAVAETVSWIWLPDKNSDTPRYVVDALITAITG